MDDERRKSVYAVNGVTKLTHYYLGDYEEEIDAVGNIRKIHYLSGGDGFAAILVQNQGKDSLMYAYTDFQGSLSALTDESGNVLEKYAFDPWGNRRDPDDWSQEDSRTSWLVDRGYTLHEHLDAFGIINMNGRVYDPLTAVFFSPDQCLQSPDDWLNYNRYTYCLNNPLKYTDPSGEVFGVDDALVILGMSYLGGVEANCINTSQTGHNPLNPGNWNWKSATTYIGIASGALSGIGMAGYPVPTLFPKVDGMISRGVLQAGIDVGINGLVNTILRNPFFENWKGAALSGFINGAITGYLLSHASGDNYWWGGSTKYGRNQWSFFTSEKPYASFKFDLINGSRADLTNECGPATLLEVDDDKGGNKSFDDCAKEVGYIKNVGTPDINVKNALIRDYGGMQIDNKNIYDADYMKEVLQSHDEISVYGRDWDHSSGIGHWDNFRQVDYYSNYVNVKLRIGSYKLTDDLIKKLYLLFYRIGR